MVGVAQAHLALLPQELDRAPQETLGVLELRAATRIGVDQQLRVRNVPHQMPGVNRWDHDVVGTIEHPRR